ncbi:MAG: hypothetical protein IKJ23_09505, partial [Bacteroidaceae bacterium]|nr:hypothetical protein [Bacteroidaceae bacterium]
VLQSFPIYFLVYIISLHTKCGAKLGTFSQLAKLLHYFLQKRMKERGKRARKAKGARVMFNVQSAGFRTFI